MLIRRADQNMKDIVAAGALPKLIALVSGLSEEAQTEAARALCNLARDDSNATLLVGLGALKPFIAMLGSPKVDTQGLAVVAMVNLSMNGAYETASSPSPPALRERAPGYALVPPTHPCQDPGTNKLVQ